MNITKLFDEEPRFKRLARRRNNFRLMCAHALEFAKKNGHCHIVETGVAWDTGNWEGQGQSTLIWDWLITHFPQSDLSCDAIDITPKSVENAKAQTTKVNILLGDSVKTISEMGSDQFAFCGLVYLDSFDWEEKVNVESAFHHMAELTACYRDLPSGCLIVVDDRHGDGKGKHWMVEGFMEHYLKVKPVFKNHQIGFIKP